VSTDWQGRPEAGGRAAVAIALFLALNLGRALVRVLLYPATLYFFLRRGAERRGSRAFLTRALGRPATTWQILRNMLAYSQTMLDRIYLLSESLQRFDVSSHGLDVLETQMARGRGVLLLGAHIGSFEALHAVGADRPGLRVAMAMFPHNARMIHETLQAVAPHFHLDIITIGRSQSTLEVRDWLDGGGLVGMLGDRVLKEGPRSSLVELPFLGQTARFSDAPLRLAMLLRRRVVFMVALYRGGARYDLRLEPLADFSEPSADPQQRDNRLREALQAYVQRLEALCREAPYNWFNFFDFWNEDARP